MKTVPLIAGLAALSVALLVSVGPAQSAGAGQVRLANDVVPAPDGFENVTAKYIAVGPTDLYISPFLWAGKVFGAHLNAGQSADILARPKGYDWLLVGKNGIGIGYVPMSALSPVKP